MNFLIKNSVLIPYGKWYENKFKNKESKFATSYGIIGISKKDIIQHLISYYKDLMKDL